MCATFLFFFAIHAAHRNLVYPKQAQSTANRPRIRGRGIPTHGLRYKWYKSTIRTYIYTIHIGVLAEGRCHAQRECPQPLQAHSKRTPNVLQTQTIPAPDPLPSHFKHASDTLWIVSGGVTPEGVGQGVSKDLAEAVGAGALEGAAGDGGEDALKGLPS